jgi:membrane-associated phospholipid phosphatase
MRPQSPRHLRNSAATAAVPVLGAFATFCVVAALHEPTVLDRVVYDLAGRLYDRHVERAQHPLEIIGLPGAYIPAAYLIARAMRRHGRRGGSALVVAAWSGWLSLRLVRLFFHRPRPPRPPRRGPKRESTFPSGHTTGLTTLAIVAATVLEREGLLTPGQARLLRVGLPLTIGVSRIYVREHWLTDVLGAWALGGTVAASCLSVVRRPTTRGQRRRAASIAT